MDLRYVDNTSLAMRQTKKLRTRRGHILVACDAAGLSPLPLAMVMYGVKRMLQPLSIDDSLRLRSSFEEAGYTETNLKRHLGAAELPSYRLRNEPRLLDRTREVTLLTALFRWFWLGRSQSARRSPMCRNRCCFCCSNQDCWPARRPVCANNDAVADAGISGCVRSPVCDGTGRLGDGSVAKPNQQISLSIRHSQAFARHSRPWHREWDS